MSSSSVVSNLRYGGPSETRYQVHGPVIAAAMAAPTVEQQFISPGQQFRGCRWWIDPAAADAAKTYTVHVWRSTKYYVGGVEVLATPVEEDTIAGVSGGFFYDQPNNGDLLAITIDTLSAPAVTGWTILRKGVS